MKDSAIRRWGLVAAVSLSRVAFGYQFQSLASLGPELLQRFGLGYAELGGLIGLYMAPGVLVALPGGLLGRRYGERLVVGGGLALMTLGTAACAGAGGPSGIGIGRAVAGAGAVMLVVMQGKMIGDRFPGRSFLPVMGLVVGAFPVGVGLVELTHGPVVRALGWPGIFIVGAGIAAAALLLFLVSSERAHPDAGAAWALPSRRECALVTVAGVVWTAYNAGYYGFLSYMPSVLASRGHPPGMLALVLTLATWLNLPATVLGGALAARFGNRPVFLAGTVAGIVAVAGPAVLDWPLLWGLLFGTVASLHAGVIIGVGTLSARPENRAVGMGLFYAVYYAGGALLPAMCGRAADLLGDPAGALIAAAALSAVAIPAFMLHGFLSRRDA
ncbi:MAG: MFS transporter [Janthinobacterium lividum]